MPASTLIRVSQLIAVATSATACIAPDSLSSQQDEPALGESQAPIFGPNAFIDGTGSSNTFDLDTVVRVDGDGRCTGTLITPNIVLTAGHCTTPTTIGFGPNASPFKGTRTVISSMTMGTEAGEDLQLLWLDGHVWEEAKSVRPAVHDWASSGNWEDPPATLFGIAGWSRWVGPWGCPDLDPGTFDPVRDVNRFRFEAFFSDFQLSGDTITFPGTTGDRPNAGDSGGPLYRMWATGREVIGVLSRNGCDLGLDLSWRRYSLYTNVTSGAPADWIRARVVQNRSAAWMAKHGKSGEYWEGEGDYLGPCQGARDADCDHWYNEHDYCPYNFDPGQAEGSETRCVPLPKQEVVNGAIRTTSGYTDRYDETIPITDVCPPGGDCPVGFCYWKTIHGPFWQSTTGATNFDQDQKFGTALAIRVSQDGTQWVVRSQGHRGARPVGAAQEPTAGAGGTVECTAYRDIATISGPALDACSQQLVGASQPAPGSETGVVDFPPGNTVLPITTGFLGNVAQRYSFIPPPGGPPTVNPDFTEISYLTLSSRLSWKQGLNLPPPYFRGGVQREGFAYGCGVPNSFVYSVQRAVSKGDILLRPHTGDMTDRCFITGLRGAWHMTRAGGSQQPFAEIYTADNGDIRFRVGPATPPASAPDDRVEATAACIKLRP